MVDTSILKELSSHIIRADISISKTMIEKALAKNSNASMPGLDYILWYWLKQVTQCCIKSWDSRPNQPKDSLRSLRNLINICIDFSCFFKLFK
jgi:hypothetical protein